jgi:hypothetical protein
MEVCECAWALAVFTTGASTCLGRSSMTNQSAATRRGTPASRQARAWYGDSVTKPRARHVVIVPLTCHVHETWSHAGGADDPHRPGVWDVQPGPWPRCHAGRYWLHGRGVPSTGRPPRHRIKVSIRKHFFPDTEDWKEMVLFRTRQILRQAQAGLAQV